MPVISKAVWTDSRKRGDGDGKYDWATLQVLNLEYDDIFALETPESYRTKDPVAYVCVHGVNKDGNPKNCPIASAISRVTKQTGLPMRTFNVSHLMGDDMDNWIVVKKLDKRNVPQGGEKSVEQDAKDQDAAAAS